MRRFLRWLDRCSPVLVFHAGAALVVAIGILDHFAAPEIVFSLFYLVPVLLVCWCVSRPIALLFAVLAAAVSTLDELTGMLRDGPSYAMVWSGFVQFAIFLLVAYLTTGLRAMLREEHERTLHDPLTGLYNTRAFYQRIEEEIGRSRRYGRPFTIAYLDLDNFKAYNDSHGHPAGDTLLRTVAGVMCRHIRATDMLARLGGDEFGILFVESEVEAATHAVDAIQQAVRDVTRRHDARVTVSVGMATHSDLAGSVSELIRHADDAMYKAKKTGKDRLVHFAGGGTRRGG